MNVESVSDTFLCSVYVYVCVCAALRFSVYVVWYELWTTEKILCVWTYHTKLNERVCLNEAKQNWKNEWEISKTCTLHDGGSVSHCAEHLDVFELSDQSEKERELNKNIKSKNKKIISSYTTNIAIITTAKAEKKKIIFFSEPKFSEEK